METIIVATDFSAPANNALQYAAALAANLKARIVLFNAFQLPLHASNTLLSPAGVDGLLMVNQQRLETMALKISGSLGVEVVCYTSHALLAEALDELVPEVGAGLVVLGIREGAWGDQMFGNTTTAIIRGAAYPVLVVPEKAVYTGVERILFAFDNACLSSQNTLPTLRDVASCFGAMVEVFHVGPANSSAYETEVLAATNPKVEAALQQVRHSYKSVARENVVEEIVREVATYHADLLAVVPHRFTMWERLVRSSITRALALKAQVPMLVLPNVAAPVTLYN